MRLKTRFSFLSLLACLAFADARAQATYCSSSPFSTADEEIYNVMLNGAVTNPLYSFSNGCTTPAPGAGSQLSRYSNFKSLGALTTITVGVAATYSVQEDECDGPFYYSHGIAIWIDFNGDGDFFDQGENVHLDANTLQGPRAISGSFIVPQSAVTGSTVMRVIAAEGYSGSNLTPCISYGYGETEDYRVDIVPAPPCSGTPAGNTIVGPTGSVCPNTTTDLMLSTMYPFSNITYEWQYSSTGGSVGLYVPASGSPNNYNYTTPPMTANTWYRLVVGCGPISQGFTVATTPFHVMVAPTTTNSVPYHEGFEGITADNMLPNCSWSVTNLGSENQTYIAAGQGNRIPHTGSKFASFYYQPSGTSYFYSNQVWLEPNVTYSANIWYTTEPFGYNNWTDLSILYGTTQSPNNLTLIASTNGPAISTVHKALGNTFTVPTAGFYNIAIRATSNNNSWAEYLSWDDLTITAPCNLNAVPLTINSNSMVICRGELVNLFATGADAYMWNNGANTFSLTDAPTTNTVYSVVGTNTASGCSATISSTVFVKDAPNMFIISDKPAVCKGSAVTLVAYGASTYTWTTNNVGSMISYTPTQSGTVTVVGTNNQGCQGSASLPVTVNELPSVTANVSRNTMCVGETVTVSALSSDATTFQWVAYPTSQVYFGKEFEISPTTSHIFTVTATSAAGCSATSFVSLTVDACVGLKEQASSKVLVYPNPAHSTVNVVFGSAGLKNIVITDVSGRVILEQQTENVLHTIDLSSYSNGVYYLSMKGENLLNTVRIIKD